MASLPSDVSSEKPLSPSFEHASSAAVKAKYAQQLAMVAEQV